MPKVITQEQWRTFVEERRAGETVAASARAAKISVTTARAFEARTRHATIPDGVRKERPLAASAKRIADETKDLGLVDPIPLDALPSRVKRAVDDFGYFRRRYFGRVSTPWQEEAGERARVWLESPEKTFVVVNCPPGSGKSTLFTHDIPLWLLVRDRALRSMLGSRTETQAHLYTRRIKRALERRDVVRVDESLKEKGVAFDAEATLVDDFGRFKPRERDLWRGDEFVVAQWAGIPLEDKESTFAAWGMDSGFLGGRYNLIVWDDLVDKKTLRTENAREEQRKWFEEEAETRLEPGGLFILQGQRMGPEDLYRYALDQVGVDLADLDDDLDEVLIGRLPRKYEHVIYKAHYEDRCLGKGSHGKQAKPYPEGCLLDPQRLPYRELRMIERNRSERYRVLYQQEEVDPAHVLVPKDWIDGGVTKDGEVLPGCWDNDRDICELPKGLSGRLVSVATADPSPTKFWSIQWWVYHPDTKQRFLMDLVRQAMDAPDFLDWNHQVGVFSGVMHEWQQRSVELGLPISTWVVEANAAQRFLLQYDHVRRWQSLSQVSIVAHQTARNKSDPDYGVQTLAPLYRHGLVRLPGKDYTFARPTSLKLIDEVTRWPEGGSDDCVMAQWFFEWNLRALEVKLDDQPRMWRPSWFAGQRRQLALR